MEIGAQTVHGNNARFGHVLHVERWDKKSKTEVMHVTSKLNQEPLSEGTMKELREKENINCTTELKYLASKVTSKMRDK
jgi:hypothetical protein